MKIDEKTSVPLVWVIGSFGTLLSVVTVGAFWISTVNFRLSRIEQKLGIPPITAKHEFSTNDAVAGESDNHAHFKRLFKSVEHHSAHN